jgi:hypothetical protein
VAKAFRQKLMIISDIIINRARGKNKLKNKYTDDL